MNEDEANKTSQPPGMGVRFTNIDKEMEEKLSAFIRSSAVKPDFEVNVEES